MSFTPPTEDQRFVIALMRRLAQDAGGLEVSAEELELTDAILEGVGAFAAEAWAPLARRGDMVGARLTPDGVVMPDGYAAAYKAYVEGGWGTIGGPPAYGGQGLSFLLSTSVLETLGGADMAFALCPTLTVGAIESLIHHGSDAQRAAYLPKLVSGEWTGTMNLTEPQAGSDVGALRTQATPRADGGWSIKGTKIFITYGDHDMAANIIHLVLARTPGAPAGTKGISLFLVPKRRLDTDGAPGEFNDVRVASIEHKLGIHASPTCVLSFGDHDDCVGELIGEEGGGMRAMFTMMNSARLNVGLQGVQLGEGATQKAVGYSRDRVQSARAGSASREPVAIVEHPDVRRMLMRMKAQTQAARALLYYAASQVDRANAGDAAGKARLEVLTPLAKSHATDLGCEIASLGVQVHGGAGFIEETGAAQFYRDARITPIYEGTNGIQAADLVGRKLSMDGGEAVRALLAEVERTAEHPALRTLSSDCGDVTDYMLAAGIDDRLAGGSAYLTMLSVAVCGWLMEEMGRLAASGEMPYLAAKRSVCRFYLDRIVPEASGLKAAAMAGAAGLYELDAEALAS